jgi:hypothetical protein
LQCSE